MRTRVIARLELTWVSDGLAGDGLEKPALPVSDAGDGTNERPGSADHPHTVDDRELRWYPCANISHLVK